MKTQFGNNMVDVTLDIYCVPIVLLLFVILYKIEIFRNLRNLILQTGTKL